MNTSRLLYLLVVTTATIMKANAEAEADNHSILTHGLSGLRGTYLKPVGKKKKSESVKHNVRRILNKGTTNIFSRAREDDDCCFCCCDSNDDENQSASASPSISMSSGPSVTPSHTPTASPSYSEKKFLASDGESGDDFGQSCSMADDLVVLGAPYDDSYEGAAYLFELDGTEVIKLEAGDDFDDDDYFGFTVSIDEKVVVGTGDAEYVRIFSLDGTYERTLTCDDCRDFGQAVVTLGNKIVTKERKKLFIYKTDGDLLKEFDEEESTLNDVAITNEYIVAATLTKTFVYSNVEPDFPLIVEIEQYGGRIVAAAGDKLVIGDYTGEFGSAWLYNIDGTLVKELEHDNTIYSCFACSIAITNDKIIIGAANDNLGGGNTGSVFFYSAIDGAFEEKVLAPDAEVADRFGRSVCSNGSYYMVGAPGYGNTGAAYLFNLPL